MATELEVLTMISQEGEECRSAKGLVTSLEGDISDILEFLRVLTLKGLIRKSENGQLHDVAGFSDSDSLVQAMKDINEDTQFFITVRGRLSLVARKDIPDLIGSLKDKIKEAQEKE